MRGCLQSLIYDLSGRLEVAATRDFTHLPYGTLRERGLKTLDFLLGVV